jgi:hypothetical protein
MAAAISQQKQETICCPTTEIIEIYERLENIIGRSKSVFKIPKKYYTQKNVYQKTITQQVIEHKNKAIEQALLMFGTLN